jgi:RNAse (barnase) inhibitor barstar
MTEINTEDFNTIYLILDGNKTVDKASFLTQIKGLLKISDDFESTWDVLKDCLNDVTTINNWKSKEFSFIEDNVNIKVNIIWLDPLDFSKYNSADFYTAIDILKSVTEDETNPLIFVLASNISNVNTDLFK